MENMQELEFKTHLGEFYKCKPEEVLELFPSILTLGDVFERFDFCVRTTDPTGKYSYHVWGITEKTARWLSQVLGMQINKSEVEFISPATTEEELEEKAETVPQYIPDKSKEALRIGLNNFFKDFKTGEIRGEAQ
jgi:hypothetical protein